MKGGTKVVKMQYGLQKRKEELNEGEKDAKRWNAMGKQTRSQKRTQNITQKGT